MIYAELVDGCHLKCALCWNRNRHGTFKNMELETVDQIIGRFRGQIICWYNWGEPVLHKRLGEVAELLKNSPVRSVISTTLSFPVSDEKIEALCKFDLVFLALSGITADVYNKYHIGGDFDLAMKNFKRLSEANKSARIMVKWLRHPDNKHQIKNAFSSMRDLGFTFVVKEGLNCEIEDLIEGFDHPYFTKGRHKHDGCSLMKDVVIDVEGNYLVCCGTHNVKIGLSVWDDVSYKDIIEARLKTPICIECREKELFKLY